MKKEYDSFFKSIDLDELRSAWNKAKNEKKIKRRISFIISIIISIPLVIFMSTILPEVSGWVTLYMAILFFILVCALVCVCVFAIKGNKMSVKYRNIYKEKVISELMKNTFDRVEYHAFNGMPEYIYTEMEYPELYNTYYSNDYVNAYIDDKYPIKMADVTTQMSDRDDRKIITFKGLFAKIYMDKSINSKIIIKKDAGFIESGNIQLDSKDFEEIFDVTTTNKIVAMQILTHDVMELLIDYRNRLGKTFDIIIKGNVLAIRLHVGEMFEDYFNEDFVVNGNLIKEYYDILDFIDTLSKSIIKIVEETQT